MKTLQRALEVIAGVGLCFLFEPFDLIKGGIALFLHIGNLLTCNGSIRR